MIDGNTAALERHEISSLADDRDASDFWKEARRDLIEQLKEDRAEAVWDVFLDDPIHWRGSHDAAYRRAVESGDYTEAGRIERLGWDRAAASIVTQDEIHERAIEMAAECRRLG